jgi:hypothetical protein
MHTLNRIAARAAVALVLAASGLAQATTTELSVPGQWYTFDVEEGLAQSYGTEWIDIADGSALTFTFTIAAPALLRVVDAGFAGDRFNVTVNGASFATSAVPAGTLAASPNAGLNFDAAWANPAFSQGAWLLSAPGLYTVTGSLLQSVTNAGAPLNSTVGALMLAPVPEPTTWMLLLAGLGVIGVVARRRA